MGMGGWLAWPQILGSKYRAVISGRPRIASTSMMAALVGNHC
jgi:hypothetical protein